MGFCQTDSALRVDAVERGGKAEVQTPRGWRNMAKRCALYFGVAGYLLAFWYYRYAFAPLTWQPGVRLLGKACFSCMCLLGAGWGVSFLILGPLNGLIYAAL